MLSIRKSSKIFFILIFIFCLNIFSNHNVAQAHNTDTEKEILMTKNGFEPNKVEIPLNGTVEFVNKDDEARWPASNFHPSHLLYPEFDPKQGILPGETWIFTANKEGVWRFHDHLLPQFSGTITVTNPTADQVNEVSIESDKSSQSFWQKLWGWLKKLWPWTDDTSNTNDNAKKSENKDDIDLSKYTLDIPKGDKQIFTDDIALGSHLKKYGTKDTITNLRLLESELGSCHQPAHRAGHIGYKMFGDKAFVEYSAECQSGYYHGVLEKYFQENGASNVQESLNTLCKGSNNGFFEHQCVHGIGHGLMAWANYELPEALDACDQLPKRQDSCYTGVFMENLAAKLIQPDNVITTDIGSTDTHYTKYLKDDDALYPCNWVAEKYQGSCYFLQTSRMLQIFGTDFAKVNEACEKVPYQYQNSCFGSMGRDVGGRFPNDAPREIKECGHVKDKQMRIACLNGAVQNGFWDPSGQNFAVEFCKLLKDSEEKSGCYMTITSRAPEIMFEKQDLQNFCVKLEPSFIEQCKTLTGI